MEDVIAKSFDLPGAEGRSDSEEDESDDVAEQLFLRGGFTSLGPGNKTAFFLKRELLVS
ncbi:MAG: hypothetical protein ABII00_13870 [Elusimicrobiota bacterium]